jgi:hypothetical protein
MTGLALLALVLSATADGGAPSSSPALLAPIGPATKKDVAADRPYELRREKNGDLVYEAAGFTARIARDGTPRFVDKGFALIRPWSLLPFAPLPTPRGRPSLQSAFEDLLARRDPRRASPEDPSRDPPPEPLPVNPMMPMMPKMSPYRPDPAEACQYPRSCWFEAGVVLVGLGGTFDLTDALMRLSGKDPYRQEKARFLVATSELRAGLSARFMADTIRREAAALPARLEAIACDAGRSVRERRAVIESLRQEMDGDTPAARNAVAVITRFLATFEGRFDEADGGARCP